MGGTLALLIAAAAATSTTIAPVGAIAADGPSATSSLTVSGLVQEFSLTTPNYTVACADAPDQRIPFSATLPSGWTISVDGARPATPGVSVQIPLLPNQRFTWALDDGTTTRRYSARCTPRDLPPMAITRNGVPQSEYYVVAPLTFFGADGYVIVVDSYGTPVWWQKSDVRPIDAKLRSDGQLTWHDNGPYTVRNLAGDEVGSIGTGLDSHDLIEAPGGTHVGMRYVGTDCANVASDCRDLTSIGGPAAASPINAQIVEMDETGDIWTWNSQDHISIAEAAEWFGTVPVGPFNSALDIVHINSIELDAEARTGWPNSGGLLMTARHLNAVYHIDRATGDVDWKIGGTATPQSLTVLDAPPGTPFLSGLHDVRLLADGTITVHDNGTGTSRGPRAMRLQVDTVARTARVVEVVSDARVPSSFCCGSTRRLPGGNWVSSWGFSQLVTEQDPAGAPVFTIQFDPGWFSYRAVPVARGVLARTAIDSGMDSMAAPGAPVIVAAHGADGSGLLSWSAPSALPDPLMSYAVQYRAVGETSWIASADVNSPVTSSVVPGLTNGTAYEFRVAARNVNGLGPWSGPRAVTPRSQGFHAVRPVRLFDTRNGRGLTPVAPGVLPPGRDIVLRASDLGGFVPTTGLSAMAINLTATAGATDGFLSVQPCGSTAEPRTVSFRKGATAAGSVVAGVSAAGTLCLRASAAVHVAADLLGWHQAERGVVLTSPVRLFDTRNGTGLRTVPARVLGPGSTLAVNVNGLPNRTPATGVKAVIVNLTVTGTTSAGIVRVRPCGSTANTYSAVATPGTTATHQLTVKPSASGDICITSTATSHVIADLIGWHLASSDYQPVSPARLADSRTGGGLRRIPARALTPATELVLKVSDIAGYVPATSVEAVVLGITSFNATASGHLRVRPCGAVADTSALNFATGRATTNQITVGVSGAGTVCILASASTHVAVDLIGWHRQN